MHTLYSGVAFTHKHAATKLELRTPFWESCNSEIHPLLECASCPRFSLILFIAPVQRRPVGRIRAAIVGLAALVAGARPAQRRFLCCLGID
jgi:hypothetical protein